MVTAQILDGLMRAEAQPERLQSGLSKHRGLVKSSYIWEYMARMVFYPQKFGTCSM